MIDELSHLVKENRILSDLLLKSLGSVSGSDNHKDTSSVLHQLLQSVEYNIRKSPKHRRHTDVIKKFATILYIYAGSMAYEFIHQNMPEALPSLRTIQSLIQSQYTYIEEGKFRFDELLEHLVKHSAPLVVAIAEDATRIIHKVEYDPATNRCVGFVLPSNEFGLPKIDAYQAISFKVIENMFTTASTAKYAYLYVAQPLKKDTASFCLACIGTNNKFTAQQVLQRWDYIYTELTKRGVKIFSFAADGDS